MLQVVFSCALNLSESKPRHIPLDCACYTPDGPSKAVIMYCHGNQMNFYVCAEDRVSAIVTSWLERTLP